MSETVSLKRPRSTSNLSEEHGEKYSALLATQQLPAHSATGASSWQAVSQNSALGIQPPFPFMQYYQMVQQMQMDSLAAAQKREKDDAGVSSTPTRRQTISVPSQGPRPIRVPPQSLFNPSQFGLLPLPKPHEAQLKSPSPIPQSDSPQATYNAPSFQRADEEIYSKFVESVRKLAAKLIAERS